MRLFLTYLWVGGAVLYTLNTLTYTYFVGPVSDTSVSRPADKAAPRRVASWGSHLPGGQSDHSVAQPNSGAIGSEVPPRVPLITRKVSKEPDPTAGTPVTAQQKHDSAEEHGTTHGERVEHVPTNREVAAAKPLTAETEVDRTADEHLTEEDGNLLPGGNTQAKVGPPDEATQASAAPIEREAPEKKPRGRQLFVPPVAETTYPASEPRSLKRAKRRAERAGLGLFRFGPAGF